MAKLEEDKDSFRNHVANSVKSTEEGLRRLKEEEAKIVRLGEDLRKESSKVKEERSTVSLFVTYFYLEIKIELCTVSPIRR